MKTWAIFATVEFVNFTDGNTYPAPVKIASGWPTKESVEAAKEQIEAAREKSYWTWLFDNAKKSVYVLDAREPSGVNSMLCLIF